MLRGLGTAKPDFEFAVRNALYEGAKAACLSPFVDKEQGAQTGVDVPDNANAIMNETAEKFAVKFADNAAGPLADAIYNYILEMQITATASGTLIAPGGMSPAPCTGTLNPTDFSIV